MINKFHISIPAVLLAVVTMFPCRGAGNDNDNSREAFPVTATVPLYGNTYVTSGTRGVDVGTAAGISKWTSPSAVASVYFHVARPGTLHLALYGVSPSRATVRAVVNGETFTANVRKTSADTVILGKTVVAEAGYVRVDLQGVEREGADFGTYTALKIGGSATEGGKITFVPTEPASANWPYWGRRGPSVHFNWAFPEGVNVEWFYNEVTVPVGSDVVGSYFMANGFAQGYFGMQVNSATERKVLFSVWSPYQTDDPKTIPAEDRVVLVEKGEGVRVNDFGNEGSGGQSYLGFDWEAGKTYRFLNRVRPVGEGYSEYTAWFCPPEEGRWMLIAVWKRPKTQTWYRGPYSFLENFLPTRGWIDRRVGFGNQWARSADGEWYEVTRATFTCDNTAAQGIRLDYTGWADGEKFWLRNCGFFNGDTAAGTVMTRPASRKAPNIDFEALGI